MIVHNIQQGTPEWHHLRAGRVTGTQFSTLFMGKKTKGYLDLVGELAAQIIIQGDLGEQQFQSAKMEDSSDLEHVARDAFSEAIYPVQEIGFITPDAGHKFHEWIGISPDGIGISGDFGLEIKIPLAKTHFRYLSSGVVPKEYLDQVQGSLFTTGLEVWYFMSWYPDLKPLIVEVTPDKDLHERYEVELDFLIQAVKDSIENYKNYGYQEQGEAG